MGSACTGLNEPRDKRRKLVNRNEPAQQIHANQLPNSRLHEYNSAVKDFMKQQEFKALAREKNLKINGKFIKSRIGLDIRTVKLEQDDDSKNKYWLSFKYSSKEEGKITVYYSANQTGNREGVPLFFLIPESLPSSFSCVVEHGK